MCVCPEDGLPEAVEEVICVCVYALVPSEVFQCTVKMYRASWTAPKVGGGGTRDKGSRTPARPLKV